MKDKNQNQMIPEKDLALIPIDEEINKQSKNLNLEQMLKTLELVVEIDRLKAELDQE